MTLEEGTGGRCPACGQTDGEAELSSIGHCLVCEYVRTPPLKRQEGAPPDVEGRNPSGRHPPKEGIDRRAASETGGAPSCGSDERLSDADKAILISRKRLAGGYAVASHVLGALVDEIDRLRARERRLVDALRSISTLVIGKDTEAGFNKSNLCEAVSTARVALEKP